MGKTRYLVADSIRSLGEYCRVSEGAVRKWIAREDWVFSLKPPWKVQAVKAWRDANVHPDPAAGYRKKALAAAAGAGEFRQLGEIGKLRVQKLIEQILDIRQRRKVREDQLHDVAQCKARRLRQVHQVRGVLQDLGRGMAGNLANRPAEEVERLLTDRCRMICEEFARGCDQPDKSA